MKKSFLTAEDAKVYAEDAELKHYDSTLCVLYESRVLGTSSAVIGFLAFSASPDEDVVLFDNFCGRIKEIS